MGLRAPREGSEPEVTPREPCSAPQPPNLGHRNLLGTTLTQGGQGPGWQDQRSVTNTQSLGTAICGNNLWLTAFLWQVSGQP